MRAIEVAAPAETRGDEAASSPILEQWPAPRTPSTLDPFLAPAAGAPPALRDSILDSMNGVAKDTLRARAEGSEASAFGMHQADAGSDSYDRDFALSLLSQEQDALYEIEEASSASSRIPTARAR